MVELRKLRAFLFIVVLAAFLLPCFFIPAVAGAQEEWVQVQTFTGVGDKTTAPFHVSGSKWRINWTAAAENPDFGIFSFFVFPEGETVMYVESVSAGHGGGADTTYIYKGKGDFLLRL